MLKVGITGGIGSGKTLVCSIFNSLGIPIYQADNEAKRLYFTDSVLKQKLIDNFGPEFYLSETEINKSFARNLLQDKTTRDLLNGIVHPRVFDHFETWVSEQKSPYVIKEAAILFESGANKTVDLTIGVIAPEKIRVERVMKRDNLSESQVHHIMSLQLSNEELSDKCDYIIQNNEQQSLIHQVLSVHQNLLDKSAHF
jgi:dephospho-CoA kinase